MISLPLTNAFHVCFHYHNENITKMLSSNNLEDSKRAILIKICKPEFTCLTLQINISITIGGGTHRYSILKLQQFFGIRQQYQVPALNPVLFKTIFYFYFCIFS